MNKIKRLFAGILVAAIAVTCFAGCHKKNETAVKIGDIKFTSGYYACALVQADAEARSKVNEELEAKGKSTDDVDYIKQKIDGKKYETWVLDKTENTLKVIAGFKMLCKEKNLKPSDIELSNAESYAASMWDSYGYDAIYEANGVSKETLIEYTKDSLYPDLYFDNVYGKDGEKAITEEQINTTLSEHYQLANVLETTLSGDEEVDKETREKFDAYKADLESGAKTFKEVYDDFNATDDTAAEDTATAEPTSASKTEGKVVTLANEGDAVTATAPEGSSEIAPAPDDATADSSEIAAAPEEDPAPAQQDTNATLLGDKDTDSASDYYDIVKEMAVGEVKLHETEDNKLVILVKGDPLADPYYAYTYDSTLRRLFIGNDNIKKIALDFVKGKKVEFIKSATKQFKVKNIEYPETEGQTTAAY